MFNIALSQLSEFDHKNVKIIKTRSILCLFQGMLTGISNVKTTPNRTLI